MIEKELSHLIRIENRDDIWRPFLRALDDFHLLKPNDRVSACVSGGKDSFLLALLLKELSLHSDFPFSVVNLVLDPGFAPSSLRKITSLSKALALDLVIRPVKLFPVVKKRTEAGKSPCFLCARMRRGSLYAESLALSTSKVALGHHLDDVMATTYLSMMYQATFQNMVPKARSLHYPLELIRPLYYIREKAICAFWMRAGVDPDEDFVKVDCPLSASSYLGGKREEARKVLAHLEALNPKMAPNFLSALSKVSDETVLGIKENGKMFSFNDLYERSTYHE